MLSKRSTKISVVIGEKKSYMKYPGDISQTKIKPLRTYKNSNLNKEKGYIVDAI